ncbi:hypothetical protein Tco_1367541 [Tanacetum coccineum]
MRAMDFSDARKRMHFCMTTEGGLCVDNTMPELLEDATVEAIRIRAKLIVNSLESKYMAMYSSSKEIPCNNDLSLSNLSSHLRIRGTLRAQDSDKARVKKLLTSVNMAEEVDAIAWWIDSGATTHILWLLRPNDPVSINSIIESRDAIFDDNHFSLIPRPKDIISISDESQRDDHSNGVPSEIPEPRKG